MGQGAAGATIGCHQGHCGERSHCGGRAGSLGSGEAHGGTESHCVLTWRRAGTD